MATPDVVKKAIALAVSASAGAIIAIAAREGYSPQTYLDTGGVPSDCFGHTGKDVKRGYTASDGECATLLAKDADKAAQGVDRAVKTPISYQERDAYTSFVYNVGIGAFQSSQMLKLVNQNKRVQACEEFPRWVYGRDKAGRKIVLQALVNDRTKAEAMCLEGASTNVPKE